eukprot:403338408
MNGYESKIQTPSTLNELISLVPIQQRPNRNLSLTHSAKKLELKKDFRKIVKPDMNLSSAPVPPKPPQRRDIKLNENEFIQALQNQIFELKSKVLDFEMRKKTELKDGIQKDENFYSNLSDLNSYELKNFLINQIYEIKESKKQFYESSQKIKQLLHDLQTGRDFTQLREQLSTFLDNKYSQMNFELLYIDTKRELDKMNLQFAHLKHKTEQLDQQAKSNSHLSKEFKLKLQRQTDLNSKQHKTILTQNKINSEKSLKVESLLHSIFTLTQEEEIVKNSKFKEEIVLKRTINFLLRENFELKKQCRIKDSYLESAQIEINRLKTKVNRLMLKIEEDNNINKNVNGNIVVATNQTKYKFSAQQSAKIINLQPLNRIQNDITHILQSQKSLIDGQVSLNHLNQRYQDNNGLGNNNLRHSLSPSQIIKASQITANGIHNSHKSNVSGGSIFDFEILSTGNAFHGQANDYGGPQVNQKVQNEITPFTPTHGGIFNHFQEDDNFTSAKVLSRGVIENFDIDYRIKVLMDVREQDMHEELLDGSKQKFIEVTMSSQPMIHKERVDFLARNYIAFKRLSDKLNLVLKIITLNELYSFVENNKEIRMSSVDDIVGYVLNNQQDLITADLQKYIQFYQSISQFSSEDKFFDGISRKSAILLPVKDIDTGMPLGVLEIVNSNSGVFDLDCQYMSYMIADFAGFVINSLNNEIRRRKAEHSRTLLNQYAVKIFSQHKLSDLNKIACKAIKEMLSTDQVKFCFIQESLIEVYDYEIVAFTSNNDHQNYDDEDYVPKQLEPTYSKYRTKEFFGIMGHVMNTLMPTIIWNPKNDDRYNELIDMKTENPMYCFPLLETSKITQEKKIVGCVQFENLQLRLLKGTQTIQIQQNLKKLNQDSQSSILIDEHMKALMKEFSSYIAEVLKIIRNQKLLKKFKNFILKQSESELDSQLKVENQMIIEQLTKRDETQNIDFRLNLDKVKEKISQNTNNNLKLTVNNTPSYRQDDNQLFEQKSQVSKLALDASSKKESIIGSLPIPSVTVEKSLSTTTNKKHVGFALLKQMTRVNHMKSRDKKPDFMLDRKDLVQKATPKKSENTMFQFHNLEKSPQTQQNKTAFENMNQLDNFHDAQLSLHPYQVSGLKSRNHLISPNKLNSQANSPPLTLIAPQIQATNTFNFQNSNFTHQMPNQNVGQGSVFESESIQDTDDMISQNLNFHNHKKTSSNMINMINNSQILVQGYSGNTLINNQIEDENFNMISQQLNFNEKEENYTKGLRQSLETIQENP